MKRPSECANSHLKVLILSLAGCALGACAGGGGGGGHHGGGGGGGGGGMPQVAVGFASVVPSNFVSGKTGVFAVTVQNTGMLATSSTTTVTATLPTGLSYASGSGAGWSCAASSGASINCTTSAVIGANASASLLSISIAIAASASNTGVINFSVANPQGTNGAGLLPVRFDVLYTVGGTVAGLNANGLVLADNGGDQLAVGANGPFTFATALPNGNAYAAAVATQPAPESCQVQSASGTIAAANVTSITVSCVTPSGHYAFVGNNGASSISVYLIGTDGTLAQITGSPFPAKGVTGLAINPAHTLLYATDYGPGTVTGFQVAGGVLTAVGSPVSVGTAPDSAAIDPSGKFLYVGNANSNNVSAFTIDSGTGALTTISGSPFSLSGGAGRWVSIDPIGKYVYVSGSLVTAFSFDPMTGVLTAVPGSPFTAGGNPTAIGIDPLGKFAYVANIQTDNVSAFTINAATGALTPVTGSPYATGTGSAPYGAVVDPSGTYLFVTLNKAGTVFGFVIDSIGALSSINGGVAAGAGPAQIAFDPSGTFVYVANSGSANVSAFSVGAGGNLTALTGSPFPAGTGASSIVLY
jgi:6-phosphogluconolactonase